MDTVLSYLMFSRRNISRINYVDSSRRRNWNCITSSRSLMLPDGVWRYHHETLNLLTRYKWSLLDDTDNQVQYATLTVAGPACRIQFAHSLIDLISSRLATLNRANGCSIRVN